MESRGPPNFGRSNTRVFSNTAPNDPFFHTLDSEIPLTSLEQWSFQVKKRFQFKCSLLNQSESRLESHHLYSKKKHPELALEILNGIPVTAGIHQFFHKLYGYHTTLDDFIAFIDVLEKSKLNKLNYNHLNELKNYLKKIKPILESTFEDYSIF